MKRFVIIALLLIFILPNLAFATTMSISSIDVSQDGYSGLSSVVVGRTLTIGPALSFSGGDSVTVTSWNLVITPDSYAIDSSPSTGTITGSSNPTWTLTLNQKATYSISINPSCSGATCNGNSKTVTAKNSPVLEISATPASKNVVGGQSYTITINVKNNGEADAFGVTVTQDGSSAKMNSATKDITQPGYETGTISGGATVATTFTITGSAPQDGTITFTANSANDGSDSTTVSVDCTSGCYSAGQTPDGGTPGDGGPGGAVVNETEQNKTRVNVTRGKATISIPEIAAGKMAQVEIEKSNETGIRTISITVINSVRNMFMEIVKKEEKPDEVTSAGAHVYRYIEITKANITDDDISSVTIDFEVEKSWIDEKSIDSDKIYLERYESEGWNNLTTVKTGEDASKAYYRAVSPGLSIFAITGELKTVGEEGTACGNNACESGENQENCPQDCKPLSIALPPMPEEVKYAILILVILIVGIGGWLYYRGRKKTGYKFKSRRP